MIRGIQFKVRQQISQILPIHIGCTALHVINILLLGGLLRESFNFILESDFRHAVDVQDALARDRDRSAGRFQFNALAGDDVGADAADRSYGGGQRHRPRIVADVRSVFDVGHNGKFRSSRLRIIARVDRNRDKRRAPCVLHGDSRHLAAFGVGDHRAGKAVGSFDAGLHVGCVFDAVRVDDHFAAGSEDAHPVQSDGEVAGVADGDLGRAVGCERTAAGQLCRLDGDVAARDGHGIDLDKGNGQERRTTAALAPVGRQSIAGERRYDHLPFRDKGQVCGRSTVARVIFDQLIQHRQSVVQIGRIIVDLSQLPCSAAFCDIDRRHVIDAVEAERVIVFGARALLIPDDVARSVQNGFDVQLAVRVV